jgi:guanylate kinase
MKDSLIIAVGKSGVGKNSLVDTLCAKRGYTNIKSHTTRQPRENDCTHTYITKDQFKFYEENKLIYASDFLFGNYYFTTKKDIFTHHFYITSPKAAHELRYKLSAIPNFKLLILYFECDDDKRVERLIKRGDNYKDTLLRIEEEKTIFKNIIYDKKINTNLSFEQCYNQLKLYSFLFYKY